MSTMDEGSVEVPDEGANDAALGRRFRPWRSESNMPTYIGIAITLIGFVAIAFTWGKVAGLDSVPLQLPYFISGGLTGLGLILVGLTIVNVASRQRDADERTRQTQRLAVMLGEIRSALEERQK